MVQCVLRWGKNGREQLVGSNLKTRKKKRNCGDMPRKKSHITMRTIRFNFISCHFTKEVVLTKSIMTKKHNATKKLDLFGNFEWYLIKNKFGDVCSFGVFWSLENSRQVVEFASHATLTY